MNWFMLRRARGAMILILIGIVALLSELTNRDFWWPLLLIGIGGILLAERLAWMQQGPPPLQPPYPPGQYPGAYPGQYPGQYPAAGYAPYAGNQGQPGSGSAGSVSPTTPESTAMVVSPPTDIERH